MKGLRTQEGDKFERFFSLVQRAAEEKGMVFFSDSGEGRDIVTPDLEGEDLFGWLIPEKESAEFDTLYQSWEDIPAKWYDYALFAIWSMDHGNLKIEFKKFG